MKILRFQWQGKVNWGILQEEDEIFALGCDPYGDIRRGEKLCYLQDDKLLGPVGPSIMVACGMNY